MIGLAGFLAQARASSHSQKSSKSFKISLNWEVYCSAPQMFDAPSLNKKTRVEEE